MHIPSTEIYAEMSFASATEVGHSVHLDTLSNYKMSTSYKLHMEKYTYHMEEILQ
jgi:hypothetical protein